MARRLCFFCEREYTENETLTGFSICNRCVRRYDMQIKGGRWSMKIDTTLRRQQWQR